MTRFGGRMWRASLVTIAALTAGAELRAEQTTAIPPGGTRVPMALGAARPIPVVEAMVNGQGPFRFILDTGAAANVLDDAFIERLGLALGEEVRIGDPSGLNPMTARRLSLDSIVLGGATFSSVEAISMDRSRLGGREEGLVGVLGLPLFEDCLVTLDYPAGTVEVRTGELPAPDGKEVLGLHTGGMLPEVDVRVGDTTVSAHIDSGSPLGLKLPGKYEQELRLKAPARVEGRGRTVNNEFDIRAAELDGSIFLGGHEFVAPTVRFADIFPHAVFGHQMLRHFAVTIDQRNARIRFARNGEGPIPPDPAPTPARAGFGMMGSPEAGGIRVRETLPGSAASAAGLRPGDLIVAINGKQVSEYPPDAIRGVLGALPVTLTIEREGVRSDVTAGAPQTP